MDELIPEVEPPIRIDELIPEVEPQDELIPEVEPQIRMDELITEVEPLILFSMDELIGEAEPQIRIDELIPEVEPQIPMDELMPEVEPQIRMDEFIPEVEPQIRKVMVLTNFVDIFQSLGVEPIALRYYLGDELQSLVHVDPLNQLIFDMPNVKSNNVRKALLQLTVDLPINQFREGVVNAVVQKGMVLANYAEILNTLTIEDSDVLRNFFVTETNSGVHGDGRGGLVFAGDVSVRKILSAVQKLRKWRISHIRPADAPPPYPAAP